MQILGDPHLKKTGWSVKEEEAASVSGSSLPEVDRPLRLRLLWAGTEMMGAGSWLLPGCLEKLQEISGPAGFFTETQSAWDTVNGKKILMHDTDSVKFLVNCDLLKI